MSLFDQLFKPKKETLNQALAASKKSLFSRLAKAIAGKSSIDDDVLDELEEILISSDVGINTTLKIVDRIKVRAAKDKYSSAAELDILLREEVAALLRDSPQIMSEIKNVKPYVLMVVGVNGAGKTTTIGKMATQFKKAGLSVVLGAGDTFRAAAVEQLKLWGERADVPVISKAMNTDPSAVAYETMRQGKEMGADVIILDTAGRLHNKVNLMQELSKIKRVMQKVIDGAPHDVMLVLDGSTGQNAAVQAREFTKATDVTCLTITKLDGTAKGGVIIGISDEFKIPVRYIGLGEKADDLQLFDKNIFVNSLLEK